ncbi:MAG: WD40-like Beta Propeller Repeat [Fibrobacteres bacterium]|nr:WD40-like Beta Propeller Repeat [Fibrobacterota bacterium]
MGALIIGLPDRVCAQAFGQNKVQYHQFKWSFFRTEHFDIYFPQGADLIASFAARHVETMYKSVSGTVGHKLGARVPIIIHNSHAEFEQTNVIRLPLHEGIGGFTEIFKNRIVLPFEGSYTEFYHVLKHEMTHAVVFDMVFGDNAASMVSHQAAQFPLWVSEGLAEYASLGWDLSSEFFMVDATTFGYVAPPTVDFGGFLAYKGGQLFLHFVETTYGKGTVTRLIKALTEAHDLPQAFKRVTRTSLEEAGEIWLRELRFIYWPELGQRNYGKTVARQLTEHGKDQSFYNLQPSISPNGEEIAYFSDKESWEAIFILNIKSEKVTRTVIQGGKGEKHESFHSFKSGISWSPDSKQMAIVSKVHGKDVIHLIGATKKNKGKIIREIAPDVQAILSPSWSRDGRWIAFSGMKDGLTDIYVWDLQKNELKQLTHDLAHDDHPAFSPSGKWIAFESDRRNAILRPPSANPLDDYDSLLMFKDIYRIGLGGDSLTKVAGGAFDEKQPSYGPSDSTLVFISNRSGIDNIYLSQDSAGTFIDKPLSNLLSGCFTPSWSWDGKNLAFSLFEEGGWDIFLMKNPLSKVIAGELPKSRFIKSLADTSLHFFRPLNWANLSSYNADSLRIDSTARADSIKTATAKKDSTEKIRKAKASAAVGAAIAKDSADLVNKTRKENDAAKARKDSVLASGPPRTKADSAARDSALASSASPGNPRADSSKKAEQDDSTRMAAKSDSAAGENAGISQGKKKKKKGRSPFLADSSIYIADDGSFRKNTYRPVWSLDNANAALGIDNQYGYGGLAYITLSDLMGDQELSFALSINGSWENTNGAVSYDYLALKTDFSLMAYHQAQLSQYSLFNDTNSVFNDSIFLDRQWGFGTSASYPFSVFTRLEFEARTLFSSRTHQNNDGGKLSADDAYDPITINALFPSIRWVHDNTMWGMVGPVNGERLYANVTAVPPAFQDRFSFVVADADFRKYWEYFKKYTLAIRVSGGVSEALGDHENPHQFWVGGEDFTFNAHANNANLPKKLEEFYFSQFDFPLRGFDYYEFKGTRKFVSNIEFRYPFIREFSVVWPIPLSLRYIMGNVFADYGGAWSQGDAFDEMGLGLGWGMRMNLGIFVLKYTQAYAIKGVGTHTNPSREYWSLGAEF